MSFKLGDHVEWTSQAGGFAKTKHGVIVRVLAPGEVPTAEEVPGRGLCGRKHESYIVKVKRHYCWPRVCQLRKVGAQ